MVAIILVSHSRKITDGLKEMIEEMTGRFEHISIVSAGGTDDGRIGTDPLFILNAIEEHKDADNIYLFADIGSAIMSIEAAIELLEDEALQAKCTYLDAPLVEGAFVGAVKCMSDASKEAVVAEIAKFKTEG